MSGCGVPPVGASQGDEWDRRTSPNEHLTYNIRAEIALPGLRTDLDIDGSAVAEHLGHSTHDVIRIVADTDHGVGS